LRRSLYAAGDIVSGLNQIAVSVGQAAIAATAVHNHLPPHRHSGSSGESKAPATADKMNQTLSVETEVQAAIP
jgi:hypothetical protein